MKKILSLILVLILCTSLMALTVSAAGNGSLSASVDKATVAAGETVTVTVKLNSNPGIAYLKLTPSSTATRTSFTGSGLSWTIGSSAVFYDITNNTYTGSILTLTYTAPDALGTYNVSFGVQAWDENEEAVSFNAPSVSFEVVCDHHYEKDESASSDATCGKDGKLVEVCSKCGDTKETVLTATGNHKYEKDESASYDATCGKDGWLVEICSVCGDCKESTVPATGKHNIVKDTYNSYDATCGKDGKLYEFCSNDCGYSKVTTIPATGNHSNGTYTKIDGNDKQHKVSCSVCGKEDELENHSWDKGTVTTPATCGQPGSKTLTCTKCGYEKTEVIDATGKHTYTYTDVNDDQHKVVCSVCGDESMENHNYNAGVVTTKPGHLPGEKTYTCADCGGTKIEVLPATTDKHNRDSVTDWTKLDDDYHQGTCECGETIKEKHNWDSGKVTVKPADGKDGERTHTCADCGATKVVVEKWKDNEPNMGDITPQVTMVAVALVAMMSTVALVFKRKTAK